MDVLKEFQAAIEIERIKTLKDFDADSKKDWSDQVLKQLQSKGYNLDKDQFIFLAGNDYRKYLEPEKQIWWILVRGRNHLLDSNPVFSWRREITTKLSCAPISFNLDLYWLGLFSSINMFFNFNLRVKV